MEIIKNKEPKLKRPQFSVDGVLNKKLDEFELTSLLNKHHFALFLGVPGSGKSSLAISLLQTKELFYKTFADIILFCPPNSRASIKNDFWGTNLPDELIYDELNIENYQEAYDIAQNNADEKLNTLIVIDDCQRALKNLDIQKLLLHSVVNRRHARLSIWILAQNYKTLPLQVRSNLTDMFIYKVNKQQLKFILEEAIELNPDKFQDVLNVAYKKPHEFLYLNTLSQRLFLNWNEIVFAG